MYQFIQRKLVLPILNMFWIRPEIYFKWLRYRYIFVCIIYW
jgi:hypothetical protein